MSAETAARLKTLDQMRASHAWECIRVVVSWKDSRDEKEKKAARDFAIQLKKLPTRIMAAGLGQALAFLYAKGTTPKLLDTLTEWVRERIRGEDETKPLLERLIHGDSDFQRRATSEVLAYLLWLGRFADGADLTDGVQEN